MEDAVKKEVEFMPTYIRCPYLSCGNALEVLGEKGYKVVGVDLDANDWKGDVGAGEAAFEAGVGEGFIVLTHDIKKEIVNQLTEFMLDIVKESGLRAVTVEECLGERP